METEYKTLSETSDEKVVKSVQNWLNALQFERRLSVKTVESYGIDIREFLSFAAGYQERKVTLAILKQMQVADFRAFLVWQTDHDKTRSSIARSMSAVRNFFKYLSRADILENKAVFAVRAAQKRTVCAHRIRRVGIGHGAAEFGGADHLHKTLRCFTSRPGSRSDDG